MLPLRVLEARYHVLPDELVEWLDSVERTIEGDEEGQHDLGKQVQPRDSGPMVLIVDGGGCGGTGVAVDSMELRTEVTGADAASHLSSPLAGGGAPPPRAPHLPSCR